MEGGHLVVGVEDKTLKIVGTDTYNYTTQQATLRLTNLCANLSSEGLDIEEFVTEDTHKTVWVIHIPKHQPKLPVYAHNKAWQRIEDSLVELTPERLNAILEETSPTYDWSAEDEALAKIRNLNQRILPGGTLFPDIVKQYDEYSIREILHNAIAHQDYTMQERVTMVETPDSVTFSNGGYFLPGSVRNAIEQTGPQKYYRNYALCQGMVNFNMIDTIGRGIRKVFTEQQKRFFPMPDYQIDQAKKEVTVKIYGKLINEQYYRLLKANPDLSLYDCIALDMVQKHEKIDKDIASRLRKLHLVEGRYPKLFLSAYTAKTVDDKELKTEYIRNKSFNDLHFKDMIIQYLRSFGGATRAELNTLLQSKLSDVLTEEQKIRKIGNMLSALKKQGVIKLTEKKKWVLVEV